MLESPVPLSEQEADSEEVRDLANRLAPALVEADELLRVPAEFQISQGGSSSSHADQDNEDDDLVDEVEALGRSEDMLRQELELAQDFSNLFASFEVAAGEEDSDEDDDDGISGDDDFVETPQQQQQLENEADVDEEEKVDERLPPIRIPRTPSSKQEATVDPSKTSNMVLSLSDSLFAPHRTGGSIHYTAADHRKTLQVRKEEHGGWYSVSLARHLEGTSDNAGDDNNNDAVREYCVAIPEVRLRQMLVGVPEPSRKIPPAQSTASPPKTTQAEPLPVRTIALRIRPDVLVGAVMEGVHHALAELQCASIIKRQGGHCQAVIRETKYLQFDDDDNNGAEDVENDPQTTMRTITYRPFFVDVRLTTYKSEAYERMLLIRIYHSGSVEVESPDDPAASPSQEELCLETQDAILAEPISDRAALHLRESASLIQRMEAPVARKIHTSTPRNLTRESIEKLVTTHLLDNYRACPSVTRGGITLPALNADDYEVIHSSWRLTQAVWDELETRDLTYTTLKTRRFGAFPSLPTLDVHYCSQLRRICRESMIFSLLKVASELEDFAREGELACANLITLLKPTFEAYGVEAPSLPRATPLYAYPLDFVAPQTLNPPFGAKVEHALNEVQAMTSDAGKEDEPFALPSSPIPSLDPEESLKMASEAVRLVVEAFRKQEDEEESARLVRKNVQVMDRLAMMQSHQKLSIQILENCHSQSATAALAAEAFEKKTGIREVPLLKWGIVVGRATGTCTVTAQHILFVTQLIPVIGGNTTTLFKLEDVEFAIQEASVSLLNPLPTVIRVIQHGQEVYSFRPSIGGARLKSFLECVTAAAVLKEPLTLPDNPSSLPSITDDTSPEE